MNVKDKRGYLWNILMKRKNGQTGYLADIRGKYLFTVIRVTAVLVHCVNGCCVLWERGKNP